MDIVKKEESFVTAVGCPTKDFITDVPEYLVAVRSNYLKPREKREIVKEVKISKEELVVDNNNDNIDDNNKSNNNNNNKEKGQGQQESKKRPRDIRTANADRLCHATKLGMCYTIYSSMHLSIYLYILN
jgi:hypothetical protein